ncbi:hypothetical protein CEXT_223951 [Caerostris extrusa]|uniref:Uncharacterized protein n=1 Tax=Caerostris extrusa TaxID=172846 RepID=A0AAV4MUM3_CAEEX|nr:hypothetical protein CEXT_223951 [Caerostris extrusa]
MAHGVAKMSRTNVFIGGTSNGPFPVFILAHSHAFLLSSLGCDKIPSVGVRGVEKRPYKPSRRTARLLSGGVPDAQMERAAALIWSLPFRSDVKRRVEGVGGGGRYVKRDFGRRFLCPENKITPD